MTVAEFIKELEHMPQDAQVKIDGERGYFATSVIYDEDWDCVIIID